MAADAAYDDHRRCLQNPRPGPQVRPFNPLRRNTLLTEPGANAKLAKGAVPIYGLTLAPAGASGYQLCPWRSPECEAACLGITSGRSKFSNVQEARIRKTRFLMDHPYEFFRRIFMDLQAAFRRHGSNGLAFAFRSNVLSDIPWETVCPHIYNFSSYNYDYTKSFDRAMRSLNPNWEGADLTLSFSGHNWDECATFMQMGGNAAVVFAEPKDHPLPESYRGFDVIDGDQSDLRIMDAPRCIVGLRAKGKINLASPFVVRV
ncbi:hypothetical protein UFOVP401_44 [uncultured Caudovirales phage]|uniref:Gene product 88 domain-containing protein n=1 Tax=uncultured Caudovirales phage TaxID=2100421 RepID=A0A6J5M653_9CAUD|nr:hypothetical protein UFOVP401_44 [uncultured Caudovirales phage]